MGNSWVFATKFRSDCFTAQTDPRFDQSGEALVNSDVGGVAVALSNIVINMALPILLQWGTRDEDTVTVVIVMLVSQVYPILLATAASMGQGKDNDLSLFDAHFAIAVSTSPVSVYFAYSAFRDLFGYPNRLFQRLHKHRTVFRWLGVVLPFLWLVVNINISFNPNAFRNSKEYCGNVSFVQWLEFQIVSNFMGVLDVMGRRDIWNDIKGRGGLGAMCLVAVWTWAVYLVRHMEDIIGVYRWRRRRYQAWGFPWWKRLPRLTWNIVSVPWFVITTSHPWTLFVIIMSLHWSYVLGVARGMVFDGYHLSYGQITSIFATIPPLLAMINVLRERFADLKSALVALPRQFYVGAKFFVTGSGDPWKASTHYDEMTVPTPILGSLRFLIIACLVWVISTLADIMWMIAYVRAGTIPTIRTPINSPHEAWKPFSVSLYIYGYCVCSVNILIWTTYFRKGDPELLETEPERPQRCRPWLSCLNIMLAPLAFVMCTAPLFALMAALPLAQQWQWDHQCDPFNGYAILEGGLPKSTASFYLQGIPEMQSQYSLTTKLGSLNATSSTTQIWFNQTYPENGGAPGSPLSIASISYSDIADSHQPFSAHCYNSTTGTILENCGSGHFGMESTLSFSITPPNSNATIRASAVDREWAFSDDAPSLILRRLPADPEEEPGPLFFEDIIFQTAVTRRNFCNTLKVCVSSRGNADLETLGPLGVVLWAQARYTVVCQRPRMYAL